MPEPTHIVIDPYLLCLPNPCNTQAHLDDFCNGLLNWGDALDREDVVLLLSCGCIETLITDGAYPCQHNLRTLLRTLVVDHIDHETVCRVVQLLIDRTSKLEDRAGVSEILLDDQTIRPEMFRSRLGVSVGPMFERDLSLLACCKRRAHFEGCECGVASRKSPDGGWSPEVSVESEVIHVDAASPGLWEGFATPVRVASSFAVLSSLTELLDQRGVIGLWRCAESEATVRDAIDHEIRSLVRQNGIQATTARPYYIGQSFIASVRRWRFDCRNDWARVLIESIARIILHIPKNSIEPFRTGTGAAASQISREDDSAIGWRTHLTKHGAAFRLMYWEKRDGTIEFANVGDKDELLIER